MEIKILVFSIILQGSSITKTILYNNSEYISIESYSLYNNDTTYSKVSYYVSGAENLIELYDDVISLRSSKQFQSGSWKIVGEEEEEEEDSTIDIKKTDSEHLELIKISSRLEEKTKYRKTDINRQISKTIPLILEHEGILYLTISSSTFSNGREIFHVELIKDEIATAVEIEEFNYYKKLLKQ